VAARHNVLTASLGVGVGCCAVFGLARVAALLADAKARACKAAPALNADGVRALSSASAASADFLATFALGCVSDVLVSVWPCAAFAMLSRGSWYDSVSPAVVLGVAAGVAGAGVAGAGAAGAGAVGASAA